MNSLDYVVDKVLEVIRRDIRKNASDSYDIGTVKRIDGNIAWVQYDENNPQVTPVVISGANCKKGDKVRIKNNNGTAFILGNDSNPPTDDTKAEHAQVTAEISGRTAEEAQTTASEAEQEATVASQTAEVAETKAVDAKETAEAILVYDHGYVPDGSNPNIKHFTAYLYQGGVDVKTKFSPEQFTWYLKTEDFEVYKGYGYTKDFDVEECGYGAEVIGKFTITDDSDLLTSNDDTLTNNDDTPYTVRASGESVRVSELSLATTIYDEEKLMVVGLEDEHLVTMSKLYEYISDNFADDMSVLYCGTATEVVG